MIGLKRIVLSAKVKSNACSTLLVLVRVSRRQHSPLSASLHSPLPETRLSRAAYQAVAPGAPHLRRQNRLHFHLYRHDHFTHRRALHWHRCSGGPGLATTAGLG